MSSFSPRLSFHRTDARTVSSGSSAWEGQLTSLVLSEYASTEMSIHALYMHEVNFVCAPMCDVVGCFLWISLSWIPCIIPPAVNSFGLCSFISSSPVVSCPVTRGTGRRVTKAVTASPMKLGVNPNPTLETSPAHTLSPPQFKVLVQFPLQLQPLAVPPSVRRGDHHTAAASGDLVDLVQVCILFWSSFMFHITWICTHIGLNNAILLSISLPKIVYATIPAQVLYRFVFIAHLSCTLLYLQCLSVF